MEYVPLLLLYVSKYVSLCLQQERWQSLIPLLWEISISGEKSEFLSDFFASLLDYAAAAPLNDGNSWADAVNFSMGRLTNIYYFGWTDFRDELPLTTAFERANIAIDGRSVPQNPTTPHLLFPLFIQTHPPSAVDMPIWCVFEVLIGWGIVRRSVFDTTRKNGQGDQIQSIRCDSILQKVRETTKAAVSSIRWKYEPRI